MNLVRRVADLLKLHPGPGLWGDFQAFAVHHFADPVEWLMGFLECALQSVQAIGWNGGEEATGGFRRVEQLLSLLRDAGGESDPVGKTALVVRRPGREKSQVRVFLRPGHKGNPVRVETQAHTALFRHLARMSDKGKAGYVGAGPGGVPLK